MSTIILENMDSPQLIQFLLRMRADMDVVINALQKHGLLSEGPFPMSQAPQQPVGASGMKVEAVSVALEQDPAEPKPAVHSETPTMCVTVEPATAVEPATPAPRQQPVAKSEITGDPAMPSAPTGTITRAFQHQTKANHSQIALTIESSNAASSVSGMDTTTTKLHSLPCHPRQSTAPHSQNLRPNRAVPPASKPTLRPDTLPSALPAIITLPAPIAKEQTFLTSEEFKKLPPHLKILHKQKAMESLPGYWATSPQSGSTHTSDTPSPVMEPHASVAGAHPASAPALSRKLPTLPIYKPPQLRDKQTPKAPASGKLGHMEAPTAGAPISPASVTESNTSSSRPQKEERSDIDITKIPPHLRHKFTQKATLAERPKPAEIPLASSNASPSIMVSNSTTPRSHSRPISPLTLNGQGFTLLDKVPGPVDQFGPTPPAISSRERPHRDVTHTIFSPTATAVYPRGFFSQNSPSTDGRPVRTMYKETCSFIVPETKTNIGTKQVAKAILALDVPFTEQIAKAIDIGARYSATARANREAVAAGDIATLIGTPENADQWLPKPSAETARRDSDDSPGLVGDGPSQKHSPGDAWQRMVRGIERSEVRATYRGRESRRSPVSLSPPSVQNTLGQASQVNNQNLVDARRKIPGDIEKSERQPTWDTHQGQELRQSTVSQSGRSPPPPNTLHQASHINQAFGNVLANNIAEIKQENTAFPIPSASPHRLFSKGLTPDGDISDKYPTGFENISGIFPSAEGNIPGDPMERNVSTPSANLSTTVPKAQIHKADTTTSTHIATSVEQGTLSSKLPQNFVLPSDTARLQRDSVITSTLSTNSIETHFIGNLGKVDVVGPSTAPLKKAPDMQFEITACGGWAQYTTTDSSPSNNPLIVEDPVSLLHATRKLNQSNKPVWEPPAASTLEHGAVYLAERQRKEFIGTKKKWHTAAEPTVTCENPNDLTLSPTLSIQSVTPYSDNHTEDDGSEQTVKPRPRVCIPPTAPFPAPMAIVQESAAVPVESQITPAPIPWLSRMIMQAPPHIRARAKLNRGRYIDGEYKSVNANAGVPVPQFDGAEWEFAQTRKSMVIAA